LFTGCNRRGFVLFPSSFFHDRDLDGNYSIERAKSTGLAQNRRGQNSEELGRFFQADLSPMFQPHPTHRKARIEP
jgi:hypothetical protein